MGIGILHILSGDLWGGAEAQMSLQIAAQRELGAAARALLFNSGETEKRFCGRQIPVFVAEESKGFFSLLQTALRHISDVKPEVLVSHGYKESIVAALLSMWTGIPFISTIHGGTESYTGLKALKAAVYGFLSLSVSKTWGRGFITPTSDLRQALGIQSKVIANVADVSDAVALNSELRQEIQVTAPIVCWVGRAVPVKRLDRAIEAAKILLQMDIEFHLVVVGEGPLLEVAKSLARQNHVDNNVTFFGYRTDAGRIIAAADALLLTSESEGLPTVLAEAITSGTPVVMSDLQGIREALTDFPDYPAVLVSSHEPKEFAAALKTLLERKTRAVSADIERAREWFHPRRAAREALEWIEHSVLNYRQS